MRGQRVMKKNILILVIVAVFALSLVARLALSPREVPEKFDLAGKPMYSRIIAMAPSITEVLYALDLGGSVVGVTRYCLYPPQAQQKTIVGGFLDPSFEAIVALDPDLIVVLPVHGETVGKLENLGIKTLIVDHRTVKGILESIVIIGAACGREQAARALVEEIDRRTTRIRERTRGLERPRVLLSAGRNLGTGRLEEVYVAGKRQWYDEVIQLAGGENAFADEMVQFPSLSGEGLLRLNPDVIIEMAPQMKERGLTLNAVAAEWESVPGLQAVKTGRVHVLPGDYTVIPGPRFVDIVEDLARVLHPEVDWDRE